MEATQRPRFTLVERDTVAKTADSTLVDANNIVVEGDDLFASGSVRITRTDIDATADSIYGNRASDSRKIRLIGSPGLRGKGDNVFFVAGTLIELDADEDRQLSRVQALGNGSASSPDFRLRSDTVDMYMENKVISRALAHGDSGATMTSERNTMFGTRLEILMPDGKLSHIDAFGSARAEIEKDTNVVNTTVRDFVKGDTIRLAFEEVVTQVPVPALDSARVAADSLLAVRSTRADTVTTPKSMVAIGNASIFYQRAGQTAAQKSCIITDYWLGKTIHATLKAGDIDTMQIVGPVQGASSDCKTNTQVPGAGAAGIPPK
jgi:hypothetical protein